MFNKIFIIDDDKWFIKSVERILQSNGYDTASAQDGKAALAYLENHSPDLILLDVLMSDMDGFEAYELLKSRGHAKSFPVIFVTSSDDQVTIGRCFEVGGADYIGKPVRDYEMLARIRLHLDLRKQDQVIREMQSENTSLKKHLLSTDLENPDVFADIITINPAMKSIFKYIEAVAHSTRPVLVTGETGVGKEIIAKVIHRLSGRTGECVTVNVAGLDDTLFSDTLFGHEKGAYTGAERARSGLIEKAAKGTLFLDEIGDLKMESQVKLLRLLQELEYYPIGSDERKFTDARIIVATNRDLCKMMKDGEFREDLYYRLRTHQIHIPPLRKRKGDIAALLEHMLEKASAELNRPTPQVPQVVLPILERYDFPGNIREMEALVFDAVSRTAGDSLSLDVFRELSDAVAETNSDQSVTDIVSTRIALASDQDFPTLKEVNELLIEMALKQSNGNQSMAARLLGLSRQALNKRLKRSDNN